MDDQTFMLGRLATMLRTPSRFFVVGIIIVIDFHPIGQKYALLKKKKFLRLSFFTINFGQSVLFAPFLVTMFWSPISKRPFAFGHILNSGMWESVAWRVFHPGAGEIRNR